MNPTTRISSNRLISPRAPQAISLPSRAPRTKRSGFTLVEVMIVVVIMGILAAIVIPAFRSAHAQSLESTARILAADLRLARSQAVQFDTDYAVQFDLAANSYSIVHTGAGSPPALKNPLAPAGQENGPYVVDFDQLGMLGVSSGDIRLAGVALKTTQQNVTDITFGPLGGTGPARSDDTILWITTGIGNDTRCVRITVSWVTGQVWVDPPRMLPPGSESDLFN